MTVYPNLSIILPQSQVVIQNSFDGKVTIEKGEELICQELKDHIAAQGVPISHNNDSSVLTWRVPIHIPDKVFIQFLGKCLDKDNISWEILS